MTKSSDTSSSGNSTGLAAGAAVGGIFVLGILGGLLYYYKFRKDATLMANTDEDKHRDSKKSFYGVEESKDNRDLSPRDSYNTDQIISSRTITFSEVYPQKESVKIDPAYIAGINGMEENPSEDPSKGAVSNNTPRLSLKSFKEMDSTKSSNRTNFMESSRSKKSSGSFRHYPTPI